jgi:hypothetical protein
MSLKRLSHYNTLSIQDEHIALTPPTRDLCKNTALTYLRLKPLVGVLLEQSQVIYLMLEKYPRLQVKCVSCVSLSF